MSENNIMRLEVMGRFDYVKYDERSTEVQGLLKAMFEDLEAAIELGLASGRAKSLVLTKLEEAYMWVGKSIRDSQLERNGTATLNEGRE